MWGQTLMIKKQQQRRREDRNNVGKVTNVKVLNDTLSSGRYLI